MSEVLCPAQRILAEEEEEGEEEEEEEEEEDPRRRRREVREVKRVETDHFCEP
jgi:hypothetical protein